MRRQSTMTYYDRRSADDTTPKLVGFIGLDGTSGFDLLGSLEAFAAARSVGGQQCYDPIIIGTEGKTFVSSSGAVLKAQHTMNHAGGIRRATAYQRSASNPRGAARERGERRELGWLQESGSLPARLRATPGISAQPRAPRHTSETVALVTRDA